MVVDDEEDIPREKLQWAGYDVTPACDGSECLEKIQSEKPGPEACRKMEMNPETSRSRSSPSTLLTLTSTSQSQWICWLKQSVGCSRVNPVKRIMGYAAKV